LSGSPPGLRPFRGLLLALVLPVATAPAAPAQGQWLSPPGEGWVDLTFIRHDTHREFDLQGSERRMFADGRAVTHSLFLTGSVGVWRGVDLWVQLPLHHLQFDDAGGDRVSSGLGDPKAWVRLGPEFVGLPSWPVAVRGGVKVDAGRFDLDAEVVPLGDGQNDLELLLEVGHSFHPHPLWTMAWVGYRWRFENTGARTTPGDESFWWWTLGGEAGPVGWQASLEGLAGRAWKIQGVEVSSARREITQVFGKVDHPVGPGRISLGLRAPLSGRNLPSGVAFTAGYFLRWGS
jgi:hypothetical protein